VRKSGLREVIITLVATGLLITDLEAQIEAESEFAYHFSKTTSSASHIQKNLRIHQLGSQRHCYT